MKKVLLGWMLVTASMAGAAPADQPAQYAARWPLAVAPGSSLQRLALPAEVLSHVQSRDLHDLRVFNAAGQAVPVALARAAAAAPVPATMVNLPALPVQADVPGGDGKAALSLRIEDTAQGRTVQLEVPQPASGASVRTAATTVGALVDTRALKDTWQAVELDTDWPEARPFTFYLTTSSDLKRWQAVGDVTVYRAAGAALAPPRVLLEGRSLQDQYLRISWEGASPQVQVRGVRLQRTAATVPPARVAVPLALPNDAQNTAQAVQWRMPFAAPVAALDIRAVGDSALVPVRVLVRQSREQPWNLLSRHVVFALTQDGQVHRSPMLELGQAAWREWRIEADAASPGFAEPPQITAWLEPAQLVFVASGSSPYTLAAGRAEAPAALLPLPSLIPGYAAGDEAKLPAATLEQVTTPGAASAGSAVAVLDVQGDTRRWVLWGVLAAGVVALAAFAWVLSRQMREPPRSPRD
ncbi:MAG: DUF3999 family protein [Brachymonas sp.]|nr:DUF3999 family protein [Brachymonas sp.]